MRVAIVYGRAPSGHASAAAVLESQFRLRGHDAFSVSVSSEINPILGPFLDGLYLWVLKLCPWIWNWAYDRRSVVQLGGVVRRLYWRAFSGKILAKIQELKPDAIVCAHAAPLSILALGKKQRKILPLLIACPTDYDVHSFWISSVVDLYLASSSLASKRLIAGGVDERNIIETGIPIDPSFGRAQAKAQARRELGLAPEGVIFLLSGGSRGLGRIAEAASVLLKKFPAAEVLAICGENRELWFSLNSMARLQPNLKPYWKADKDLMKHLIGAADFFIGKAGGVSIAECAAMSLPMVFLGSLPGQETRNARYLINAKAAAQAYSVKELPEIVSRLISEAGRADSLWKNASLLARPDAAKKAVEWVECLLPLSAEQKRFERVLESSV